MREFRDRVAIVTGGASGIGRALGRVFAAEGMKVVLADVEEPALAGAVSELEEAGARALGVVTDVAEQRSVDALAQSALGRFGAVHVVCNNAGVFAGGLTWETTHEAYEWVLAVNMWGVIHGVRTFVPILLSQGVEGHVVNTASMAAVTTMPISGAYHMSKHAVLALSESLYKELGGQSAKVGVSVLCPELVATGIGDCERNRPSSLRDEETPGSAKLALGAIRQALTSGVSPDVLAQRTLSAIREERFYILSDDSWRDVCNSRLEDIRLGRNPTPAALKVEGMEAGPV